jgi:DNA-binding beta-propeller fold protein YncE
MGGRRRGFLGAVVLAAAMVSTSMAGPILTLVETIAPPQLVEAAGVAVSPDDRHLYVTDHLGDSVLVFDTTSSPGPAFVGMVQDGVGGVDGLDGARAVTVSPDGANVYVVGNEGVAVFARDGVSGLLSFVELQAAGVRLGGETLHVTADGRHVYANTNLGSGAWLAAFDRDAGTGALTLLQSYPMAETAVFSPDERFLHFLFADRIATYARDPVSGLLTDLGATSGPDLSIHDRPNGGAVSPDGRHLYFAGSTRFNGVITGGVWQADRDPATGSVQFTKLQLVGTAYPLGGLVISANGGQLFGDPAIALARDPKSGRVGVSDEVSLPDATERLALSHDERRLYVVSNTFQAPDLVSVLDVSPCSPFHKAKLALGHVGADPDPTNDTLVAKGRTVLSAASLAALDPATTGVAIDLRDAGGAQIFSASIPGGAFGGGGTAGWTSGPPAWIYLDKTAAPAGGIRKVILRDLSTRTPGVIDVKVAGKNGTYPAVPGQEPLFLRVDLGVPDVCGLATFPVAGECAFDGTGTKLRCKR